MVRIQRVQIFTVLCNPFISIRRRCTFKMKRRRVRCCECGTLLPYIGFRSQMSQRPAAILLILSKTYYILHLNIALGHPLPLSFPECGWGCPSHRRNVFFQCLVVWEGHPLAGALVSISRRRFCIAPHVLLDYQQGLWYFQSQIKEPNIMPIPMTQYTFYLVVRV